MQDRQAGVVISRGLRRRALRAQLRELNWERLEIFEALANAAYGRRGNDFVVLLQKPG
jgi:hypothetical protein